VLSSYLVTMREGRRRCEAQWEDKPVGVKRPIDKGVKLGEVGGVHRAAPRVRLSERKGGQYPSWFRRPAPTAAISRISLSSVRSSVSAAQDKELRNLEPGFFVSYSRN
jgi:hypothetical protein